MTLQKLGFHHAVLIQGRGLRPLHLAFQKMVVEPIRTLPERYQALQPDRQPLILSIKIEPVRAKGA